MTKTLTLYHNPQCTKSRQTLDLLREHNREPEIIEYLQTPPDAATLKKLLTLLKMAPRDLMRKKETLYKKLNLNDDTLDDDTLIKAMITHPILIERPIVVYGNKASIGRPPEQVLSIL
ncbi:MAG: arsenate reductase (glutaredoxin) [Parvularculales bacterium]